MIAQHGHTLSILVHSVVVEGKVASRLSGEVVF